VPLLFVAALLFPLACSSGHKSAHASHRADTSATTEDTTAAGAGSITVIATAKVPQVQVYRSKPTSTTATSGASATSSTSTTVGDAAVPPIPREGYNSAGVSVDADGLSYDNPTYFGNPLVFDVVHDSGDWLQVALLARPNQQTGWIRRSDVTLSTTHLHLRLKLSNFDLQAFDGARKFLETKVVVGTPSTPTPLGTYFLTEKISRPPSGAYGPWILATSAYSETINSFDGGLPQVAFHGTNRPALIGTRSSNGCIRMPDDVDAKLAGVLPAGTPITIVP
jgi:lipoprotein-anchoring transpeptidase ErfK/SrfK